MSVMLVAIFSFFSGVAVGVFVILALALKWSRW